jgi:release factor glutamine methyltransferase
VERGVHFLRPGGRLLFEHGHDQGPCARALLGAAGYRDIATRLDLAGRERVTGGQV